MEIETVKIEAMEIGTMETEGEELDPIHTIEALCTSGAAVCQTEVFMEKLSLYTELSEELEQLEGVITKLGESPELVYSVIKIENLKSNTLQELIGLIHS